MTHLQAMHAMSMMQNWEPFVGWIVRILIATTRQFLAKQLATFWVWVLEAVLVGPIEERHAAKMESWAH